jgi:hypothetical protein
MTTKHRHATVSPQILADASGIGISHLVKALPQLRPQPAGRPAAETRLACRRCMAAGNIFCAVTVLAWTDQNLCLHHQLWTGHGVTSAGEQATISGIPEIGQAQLRHRRLARRYGLPRVRDCYQTAENIIDWSSRESTSPTARQERMRRFLARSPAGRLPRSYDYAAYYPETVSILSVLASPHWQAMAASGDSADAFRLYGQVARNGLTNGSPQHNRPLRDWIAQLRLAATSAGSLASHAAAG